jgi:hypothetical protein
VDVPGLQRRHRHLVFESLRGLILSHHLRGDPTLNPNVDDLRAFEDRAAALLDALAGHVD